MDKTATPYIISLGIAWGLNLVAGRVGVSQFDVVDYTALRLIISVIVFIGIIALFPNRRWSRDPKVWRDASIVGVFGTAIPLLGLVGALQFQSAGVTSLLITTGPAFLVTIAHFMLPDAKLTPLSFAGVLIALSGAVLIIVLGENGLPDITEASPIGYLMVLTVLVFDGFVAVFVRRRMQSYDTFEVTSIRLVAALLVVLPFSLFIGNTSYGAVRWSGWGSLIYSAIGSTVIAQLLFFYITRTFGTTSLAITIYLVPIVALIGGVVFLGETITGGILLGMVIIITGIYMINRSQRAAAHAA